MHYIYPAIFYPEDDGRYSVIFPDLNNIATFGDNLTDAMKMAQDACGQYIFTAIRDCEKLPQPSDIKDIVVDDEKAFVNIILVDFDEFARQHGNKAVKKTLTIPMWLNSACEELNINFSKVLQDALLQKIQSRK